MTNLTKRALADSLKKLLSRRPMDRITVQDVTDDAAVSRQTFYYHFHDIYDLMEWLVVDECSQFSSPWSGNSWSGSCTRSSAPMWRTASIRR